MERKLGKSLKEYCASFSASLMITASHLTSSSIFRVSQNYMPRSEILFTYLARSTEENLGSKTGLALRERLRSASSERRFKLMKWGNIDFAYIHDSGP